MSSTRTVPDEPIRIAGVSKRYGTVCALDDLDLSVRRGSITALLGPNGAGKTTTLNILLGLQRPDTGTVTLAGRTPREALAAGAVGAVLQDGSLLPGVTVDELVHCMSAQYASPMPVDEVISHAMLGDLLTRRVERLSGGETQRVLFALALVGDPQVLVLDEPTAPFSTHYLEEADAVADRIVLLGRGSVVADGTATEVRSIGGLRHIRCLLPPGHDEDLGRLPAVSSLERQGESVRIASTDSDRTVRILLEDFPAASCLEITAASLADAIDALTSQAPADAEPSAKGPADRVFGRATPATKGAR